MYRPPQVVHAADSRCVSDEYNVGLPTYGREVSANLLREFFLDFVGLALVQAPVVAEGVNGEQVVRE